MVNNTRPLRSALALCTLATFVGAMMFVAKSDRSDGNKVSFGAGTVSSYVELDDDARPTEIGVQFDLAGLEAPPEGMSDLNHCIDRNEDGSVDEATECLMTHEFVVPMPEGISERDDIPFTWVLLNWNPAGHIPPGVYDTPHFDIHFMIESEESIFAIRDGLCGPEFVQCDQFELARKPLPINYVPEGFMDVEAVVPAMGNHLIDVTGAEFGDESFTRSWIYGAYDGRITFYEEMATLKYILDKPNTCYPIKTPPAVAITGFYPSRSCIRYDEERELYTVSMEGFEFREAEDPIMAAPADGED